MKGIVKRFYFRKGFGFIEGDQGTEYFFHYSDFNGDKQDLRPGLEIEFEPQQGEKGPCAVAVVLPPRGLTCAGLLAVIGPSQCRKKSRSAS